MKEQEIITRIIISLTAWAIGYTVGWFVGRWQQRKGN
jgi:hypothetical protein